MNKFEQIQAIIKSMKIIVEAMKTTKIGAEDIENVRLTIEEINGILYHSETLKFQKNHNMEDEEEYIKYIDEIDTILSLWEQTIQKRTAKDVDCEFWEIYECFKYVDTEIIYQSVVQHFMGLPEAMRLEYLTLPRRYGFLKGKIDVMQKDFSLIKQYIEMLANEIEKYKWLYEHLADFRSKKVLNGIIRYWFDFDINKLHSLTETVFSDYYDLDIVKCDENDVMIDIGAYTGDSVEDYIRTYGVYKRIYAYEITPSTYKVLKSNLSQYPNVITLQKGVSSRTGEMFVDDDINNAGNKLLTNGKNKVEVVTLDEDIAEPVSVIKMDIEGAEKDAILGAASHIKNDRPKLLISSYHLPEDIFEIPYLINTIRGDYKFYMRFNGRGIWPCDFVLFAV